MRIAGFMLVVLAAAFGGCQTVVERERPNAIRFREAEPVAMTALVEALLDLKGVCVQSLEGEWNDTAFAARMVLKGDGQTASLVFVAPQMRLATVTLTRPHAVRFERVPQIPQSFEPEYLLADFAFVNLDVGSLRRACDGGLEVFDDGRVRRIALKGGRPLAELTRGADGVWRYRNLVYGYGYAIRTERCTWTAEGAGT
ncbi:MAG: DUF3261 domain-containing protein [Kiritimatiellia bacterium]